MKPLVVLIAGLGASALRAAGWSNKRIAREVQVHPATVGRWFAAAHLPDTNDDAAVEREETTL